MDDSTKEILLEFKMLVWAFNLGQHQKELSKLKDKVAFYIDRRHSFLETGSDSYRVDRKDLEHIYNRLDFISTNMVP